MGIWQHTWECDGLVCATEVTEEDRAFPKQCTELPGKRALASVGVHTLHYVTQYAWLKYIPTNAHAKCHSAGASL